MHIDNLIKMANQIGSFFEAMPDRDEALADIASHLKRFWEPRMRRALLAHVDATKGGEGLDPIVQAAVAKHRDKLEITLRATA
ncbi:formate dehydrogenase subunit delta [Cupriavidus sp. 2KB_3]|uniref:formate dehydrogenase subunit delta n=1 Tax=Cupriavidus TaxID=106589 RepID=UPI0011EF7DCE|nr:formate dehydrogenase subunit delta [Cupriavidus campinensis]